MTPKPSRGKRASILMLSASLVIVALVAAGASASTPGEESRQQAATTTTLPPAVRTPGDEGTPPPSAGVPSTTIPPQGELGNPEKEPSRVGMLYLLPPETAYGIDGPAVRHVVDLQTGRTLEVLPPGVEFDIDNVIRDAEERLDSSETEDVEKQEAFGQGPTVLYTTSGLQTMSDSVFPTDITTETYAADSYIYIYERGCSDPETCEGGNPKATGYTWYMAMQIVLANDPSSDNYGMHLGLARGGVAQSPTWYVDWSGYDSATGNPLLGSTGHDMTVQTQRWYRLRVWRLSCNDAGVCVWGAWLQDTVTGEDPFVGAFILYANTIANMSTFSEIIEPDPCTTDILGVHMHDRRWMSGLQWMYPAHGLVGYTSGVCPDSGSTSTNVRASGSYTIDDRMTDRTNPDLTQLW